MSLSRILAYLGLSKPYDFAKAIPVLISFAFITITLSLFCVHLLGEMHIGSPRFYFFVYIIALLIISISVSAFRGLSLLILFVAFLELSLAIMTHWGKNIGLLTTDLLPSGDYKLEQRVKRFTFHPLLIGVPVKNFAANNQAHNSLGMRGSEIELSPETLVINVYGGSSTYDIEVPDGSTWPEKLEEYIGPPYEVANFGVPGYSTIEHIIQTAFYGDILGVRPICSVYFVGWNDIRNAHLPHLDDAYANFHLVSQYDNLLIRNKRQIEISPLFRIATGYISKEFDTVPYAPNYRSLEPREGSDPKLENIFRRNIETLIAINRAKSIKTIFIEQVLNPSQLTKNTRYGWFPRVRDIDVWPLQNRFNDILKNIALRHGTTYIGTMRHEFSDADFVDQGHFSISGSDKFARRISAEVRKNCQAPSN